MVKGLAFLVFLSSLVASACISMLCYNIVTGKLPFNMTPLVQVKEQQEKAAAEAAEVAAAAMEQPERIDLSRERIAEDFLYNFYQELRREREKIAADRAELAEKQRNTDEIMAQAKNMQNNIAESEKKIRLLLDFIDDKQQENLRRTAALLSGMDSAASSKLLLQWDEKEAARVLFFINAKQTAKIVADVIQSNNQANVTKMDRIVKLMQRISDQPGPTAGVANN